MSDWDWDWDVLPLHKQLELLVPRGDPSKRQAASIELASSFKLELHLLFLISLYLLLLLLLLFLLLLLLCCLLLAPLMFRLSSEFALSNWLVGSASRPARYIFALHFSLS